MIFAIFTITIIINLIRRPGELPTAYLLAAWAPAYVLLFMLITIRSRGCHFAEPVDKYFKIPIKRVCIDEFIWPGEQFLRFEDLEAKERPSHHAGQSEPGYKFIYQLDEHSLASLTIPQAMTNVEIVESHCPHVIIHERTIFIQNDFARPEERLELYDRRHCGYVLCIPAEWLSELGIAQKGEKE